MVSVCSKQQFSFCFILVLHVKPNWITAHSELIYLFDIFDARVQKCIFLSSIELNLCVLSFVCSIRVHAYMKICIVFE